MRKKKHTMKCVDHVSRKTDGFSTSFCRFTIVVIPSLAEEVLDEAKAAEEPHICALGDPRFWQCLWQKEWKNLWILDDFEA